MKGINIDLEKLRAISKPRNQKEQEAYDFRKENGGWLRISAAISLRIRRLMRDQGLSSVDIADKLDMSPARVRDLLSGKFNFDLKTIEKLQSILKEKIIEVVPPTGKSNPLTP